METSQSVSSVATVAHLGGWKTAAQVLKTYGHANKNPKLTDVLIDTPVTRPTQQSVGNQRKTGTT